MTQEFGQHLLDYGPGGHRGIDLAAAFGSRIGFPTGGRVSFAGWDSTGFGNMVAIVRDELRVILGHMSRIVARLGDLVKPGDLAGYVGSTGRSTGNHLHLETQRDGTPINPRTYLPNLHIGGGMLPGVPYLVKPDEEVWVSPNGGRVRPDRGRSSLSAHSNFRGGGTSRGELVGLLAELLRKLNTPGTTPEAALRALMDVADVEA